MLSKNFLLILHYCKTPENPYSGIYGSSDSITDSPSNMDSKLTDRTDLLKKLAIYLLGNTKIF